ncbi:MAG TPA: hypothetical protein VKZ68_09220, partial [Ohtaekwangia sp.]|nr:hypothetical protein [Ohtaekwangia sp.]
MKVCLAAVLCLILISVQAQNSAVDETKVVVALDGSGDYVSVQEAISSTRHFSDERTSIYLKP